MEGALQKVHAVHCTPKCMKNMILREPRWSDRETSLCLFLPLSSLDGRGYRSSFSSFVFKHGSTKKPYLVFRYSPQSRPPRFQLSCSDGDMAASGPRFRDNRATEVQTGIAECREWPRTLVRQCFNDEILISWEPNVSITGRRPKAPCEAGKTGFRRAGACGSFLLPDSPSTPRIGLPQVQHSRRPQKESHPLWP
jgi:hypothetical protein